VVRSERHLFYLRTLFFLANLPLKLAAKLKIAMFFHQLMMFKQWGRLRL
jgi:hypothetical protein